MVKILVVLFYVVMAIFVGYPLFLGKMWNVKELDEMAYKKLKTILFIWIGILFVLLLLLGIIIGIDVFSK